MSASTLTRTQIYLSAAQQRALGKLAQERHQPKSELIRLALDQWLAEQQKPALSRLEMLRMARGVLEDRPEMADAPAYVSNLRKQGVGRRQAMLDAAWKGKL